MQALIVNGRTGVALVVGVIYRSYGSYQNIKFIVAGSYFHEISVYRGVSEFHLMWTIFLVEKMRDSDPYPIL